MRFSDMIVEQIANLAVWAGTDNFRWKMKNLGWTGWSVNGITNAPQPETGYEVEEE